MIGTSASCFAFVTWPVLYAIFCATSSTGDRAVVKLRSMSVPPTPWFRATNCSGVIDPAFECVRGRTGFRRSSTGCVAKPSCGRNPQIADW